MLPTARLRAAILLLVLLLPGCGREATPATTASRRIVSLSPALSRMLVDLELQDEVVGRTPYCSALGEDVAVVGDLRRVHYEDLVRLDPTHILIQAPASGVDPDLEQMADERHWHLAVWTGLDDLDDIRDVLRDLPGALALPGEPAAADLESRVADWLAAIDETVSLPGATSSAADDAVGRWSGRTLLVHSTDPVGVFGAGTYLDDLLQRLGARNAATVDGWVTLTLEDVVRLDPAAIIIVDAVSDTAPLADSAGPLLHLDIEAVREGRLAVLREPDALLPSTSVCAVARELRAILDAWGAG